MSTKTKEPQSYKEAIELSNILHNQLELEHNAKKNDFFAEKEYQRKKAELHEATLNVIFKAMAAYCRA